MAKQENTLNFLNLNITMKRWSKEEIAVLKACLKGTKSVKQACIIASEKLDRTYAACTIKAAEIRKEKQKPKKEEKLSWWKRLWRRKK